MIPSRLYIELAAAAILLIGFLIYRHALIVDGERICQNQNNALVVKMTAKNAADAAVAAEKLKRTQDDYEKEIAANKSAIAALDAQPARVIRVCNETRRNSVPTPATGPADSAAGAGPLPQGGRADTVTDFDPKGLFSLLDEADQIVAECRRANQ